MHKCSNIQNCKIPFFSFDKHSRKVNQFVNVIDKFIEYSVKETVGYKLLIRYKGIQLVQFHSYILDSHEDESSLKKKDAPAELTQRLSRAETIREDARKLKTATLNRMGKMFKQRSQTPVADKSSSLDIDGDIVRNLILQKADIYIPFVILHTFRFSFTDTSHKYDLSYPHSTFPDI